MSLLDQAISDIAAITSNPNGFNSLVHFTADTGETATIYLPNNKIGRKINSDTGTLVNAKNASVVFSERVLLAANPLYPIRNAGGEVQMMGHLIVCPDSTGENKNYIVKENICDETVGLITLLLGDYTP